MMTVLFSRPLEKVWRRRPSTPLLEKDIVWFFATHRNGIDQECLTGIIHGNKVIDSGRKDGEANEIYIIRIGAEDWLVDSSRCFEYWEDCDREARTYTHWAKRLRRIASEYSSSRW